MTACCLSRNILETRVWNGASYSVTSSLSPFPPKKVCNICYTTWQNQTPPYNEPTPYFHIPDFSEPLNNSNHILQLSYHTNDISFHYSETINLIREWHFYNDSLFEILGNQYVVKKLSSTVQFSDVSLTITRILMMLNWIIYVMHKISRKNIRRTRH